ncbi:MAG: lysophospholipid acyltransferase family protein, partial [Planctomycetota bacterium]|nr:lysophospholipid acyltransferase family protein [Planctomycetota bacterium]
PVRSKSPAAGVEPRPYEREATAVPSRQGGTERTSNGASKTKLLHGHIARKVARNMGKNIIEFLRLPILTEKKLEGYIEWSGLEHLDNALKLNKGVFILTAHLGNWDLIAAACALKGYRVNLITKHLKINLLNKFWLDYRARMNINQLYREGHLREIINALKRNELMGFILDQHTKSSDGIKVNFFNRPAWTTPSLAVLSQRYNIPVVPGFIIRQNNGRHKIIFEEKIEPCEKDKSPQFYTQLYTDVIERYVRKYPEQWIWMHRRWR